MFYRLKHTIYIVFKIIYTHINRKYIDNNYDKFGLVQFSRIKIVMS